LIPPLLIIAAYLNRPLLGAKRGFYTPVVSRKAATKKNPLFWGGFSFPHNMVVSRIYLAAHHPQGRRHTTHDGTYFCVRRYNLSSLRGTYSHHLPRSTSLLVRSYYTTLLQTSPVLLSSTTPYTPPDCDYLYYNTRSSRLTLHPSD